MFSGGYLIVFASIFGYVSCAALKDEYSNNAFLDEGKKYHLYWKINDVKKAISFAVEVETLGWVGFGISGNGNMAGGDVVIGWVKNSKGYFKDRYAASQTRPTVDDQQDYNLTAAYEKDGKTVLKFERFYDTCDKTGDRKIEGGTARLIYAYHTDDPVDENEASILRHTVRGSRSMVLLNIHKTKPKLPDNAKYFDLLVNTTVPNKSTYYLCKPFQIPDMNDTKKHVVKISPVVTPGNEGMVHHIVVYGCSDDFPVSNLSTEGECYTGNMPPHIKACAGASAIAAWAIGGNDVDFPDHVGYPIGDNSSVKFVVMEIHYDNPKKTSGIRDQSGLRFYYTESHRQYDAGLLWVGWTPRTEMWIPPAQNSWESVGYCSSNCTRMGLKDSTLPEGGIKVFAVFLHAHLLGRAIWTKHVRNNTELPEIARDNYYDFNYQEFLKLKEERHVLPGDHFETHCRYNSSSRSKLTKGGQSTEEEMCMSYMFYYPKVDFATCLSLSYAPYYFAEDFRKRTNTNPDWYTTTDWKKEYVEDIRKAYKDEKTMYMVCRRGKGKPLEPVNYKEVSKPVIDVKYNAPDTCPKPSTSPSGGTVVTGGLVTLVMSVLMKHVVGI